MSAALSEFKQSSKCLPAAATHNRSLFRNDRIALSMNSCGGSVPIRRNPYRRNPIRRNANPNPKP